MRFCKRLVVVGAVFLMAGIVSPVHAEGMSKVSPGDTAWVLLCAALVMLMTPGLGGKGYGEWDGTPMSFLMRKGLEEADSLDKAKSIFKKNKRTCEYFYVISDAKVPSAIGVGATPREITFVGPNEAKMTLNVPIKDAVVLSANERYQLLTKRINAYWGKLDPGSCIKVMRRPVSMRECLHAVLMSPGTQEMWVANATHEGHAATEQPYTYLNIRVLMQSRPQVTDGTPYQH